MTRRERWTPRPTPDPWLPIVQRVQQFAHDHGLALQGVLVLLPFAQHLPLAREAWARACPPGWMPRFETTQTLREALPAVPADPEGPSGDAATDRLAAAQLLARLSWADPMRRRDPAAFQHWVRGVVEMAHEFMHAAQAVPPAGREPWWDRARGVLAALSGPGVVEAALARVALEWSAVYEAGTADALFGLRPAGWVAVHAGGPDALVRSLLDEADAPVLEIDTDPQEASLFDAASPDAQVLVCQDFEDEAQAAAAQVLHHLAAGQVPVALIAQDRVLVRRVRALLERQHVALRDETGWRLSTTRAGACVAGLLRLARARASTDDLLDWLKSGFAGWHGASYADGAESLEQAFRQHQWVALHEVDERRLPPSARLLWQAVGKTGDALGASPRRTSVANWNERLRAALQGCGAWAELDADEAGQQVLQALRLPESTADDGSFMRQAHAATMDLVDYVAWVDSLLEGGAFAPAAATDAEVIITPLSRAMLRPFAAVVMPGCDDQRLGPVPMPAWLGDGERAALSLTTRARMLRQQSLAFAHLLRHPRISLLWRRSHDGEPLNPSVLIERLQLVRSRQGALQVPAEDPRILTPIAVNPEGAKAPRAPQLLPGLLSATSYEALRDCPYRFFALRMLDLAEAPELDDEIERRDYGTWLHAVLQRFHAERSERPLGMLEEVERLIAIGAQEQAAMKLDEAAFLPYALRFRQVAQMYVGWMLEHERSGAQVLASEVKLSAALPGQPGVLLQGKVDRIDTVQAGDGAETLVIDYKTGNIENLKRKQRQPLEDTQLAFYAALLQLADGAPGGGRPLRAIYLALDGREIDTTEHPAVEASAQQLLTGMADDLRRIAQGAALPPLGEGAVCEHCEARGLCRKDHWVLTPVEGAES
ncbi:PD-(D/E)XK nuclease family protein [Schlegelella sp. S2-27]|uniref:PD-(D/E)XK nuclease family protein n=1 Tax=Caldimonas mangrovi TaxID=2944811 RepID=A0ABT0YRK5_9BURK|nr:PD-(D/E)XK nuclease family protein [Caldimonas mangrovi]MCM5680959.1 PD-(D/E)XK nuclease family protein [Caldimonas mangrovi]